MAHSIVHIVLVSMALGAASPSAARAGVQEVASCETDPRYREFDFWLGEWEVFVGEQKVGENRIERVLGGCALVEHWTSARGQRGMSLNYYDPSVARWKQNWVSQSGGIVWYSGALEDGVMRLTGQHIDATGTVKPARVSFAPLAEGRVRQLVEHSPDGGRTWTVWFDAVYVLRSNRVP